MGSKQKWHSLKTELVTVAKLRLNDGSVSQQRAIGI
jgi:hypothetical protein